ncbi:type IV secretion system protein VirB5 [Bartonella japonica]|uniref:Type IV secretion system protein VirB5 n=1 Tax=Bartonella japonica TaxID=357761 RepID=A0ABV2FLE6_9HYPH
MILGTPSHGQSSMSVTYDITPRQGLSITYNPNYGQEDLIKEQIFSTEKIHDSITGTRTKSGKPKENDGSLYFLNPQFIYDTDKISNMSNQIRENYKNIRTNENYLNKISIEDAREEIDNRRQYAAVIDKAVLTQVFQEIEGRFGQIAKTLIDLDQMKDLKGVAELQVRMKGMLAMIQNEATKLQVIAHSHNVEQTFIKRLQRRRNVQILGSPNKGMPTIRSACSPLICSG